MNEWYYGGMNIWKDDLLMNEYQSANLNHIE